MADPLDSHVYRAQEEDVAFLVEHGTSYEDACARVGVLPATLRDRLERRDLRSA